MYNKRTGPINQIEKLSQSQNKHMKTKYKTLD